MAKTKQVNQVNNEKTTINEPDFDIPGRASVAEQHLIETYFADYEIEAAMKTDNPVEYLRKAGIESSRGSAGNGKFSQTQKDKVLVYIDPDIAGKNKPTFEISLRDLAKKVVESRKTLHHLIMPKAEKFRLSDKPEKSKPTDAPDSNTLREIPVSQIAVSRFEPQARRRAKFKKDDLQSLADSIKIHGLRQPILVRPVHVLDEKIKSEDFEIVFGERRFLAAKTFLDKINCFVEDLSDAEVLELQYEENHQRQENSPLDDAFLFKFLIERESYDVQKLSDRFAVPKREVTEKLKLNDLIPEAVAEFISEKLPLRHAYYLSKFPTATQRTIVDEQYAYKYQDIDEGATSYKEFKEEVEENIVRLLGDAPFDTENPVLHPSVNGLKCSECSLRSDANEYLFPELSGNASCLDKNCFDFKTNTSQRIKREEIAVSRIATENKPLSEAIKAVPLVTEKSWADSQDSPFKEKVLVNQILRAAPECEFSEPALAVKGEKKGEKVYICRNKDCEVHNPKPELPPADELKKLEELEAKFNEKVRKETRHKIFAEAINYFDDNRVFWQFDDLIKKVIFRMLKSCGFDTYAAICRILEDLNPPKEKHKTDQLESFANGLDKRQQSQILFLLAYESEGFYESYDQNGVKKIAQDYAENIYERFDAETRLELAPDEFKPKANLYLQYLKNGHRREIPRFWTAAADDIEKAELVIED